MNAARGLAAKRVRLDVSCAHASTSGQALDEVIGLVAMQRGVLNQLQEAGGEASIQLYRRVPKNRALPAPLGQLLRQRIIPPPLTRFRSTTRPRCGLQDLSLFSTGLCTR